MKFLNTRTIDADCEWVQGNGITMWRWNESLVSERGTWAVLATNLDLARMQNVTPGNAHITCIVDDFGNLVRKQ